MYADHKIQGVGLGRPQRWRFKYNYNSSMAYRSDIKMSVIRGT